jgi:glycerol-3-phosphate acyltransferase PlsX
MGNLPGVFRPAIAAFFPTKTGGLSTMLDLGANSENDEIQLLQFAVMGEVLAQTALSIKYPRTALLNIGSEELKGNTIIQKAYTLCKNNPIFENFMGFVEGDQIMSGDVDVTITDGFTGNIALKTLEGAVRAVSGELIQFFNDSFLSRLTAMAAYPILKKFKRKIDPSHYNGAVFLGVKGIAVKSHGASNAKGFSSAIRTAKTISGLGLIEKLEEQLKKLPPELLKG